MPVFVLIPSEEQELTKTVVTPLFKWRARTYQTVTPLFKWRQELTKLSPLCSSEDKNLPNCHPSVQVKTRIYQTVTPLFKWRARTEQTVTPLFKWRQELTKLSPLCSSEEQELTKTMPSPLCSSSNSSWSLGSTTCMLPPPGRAKPYFCQGRKHTPPYVIRRRLCDFSPSKQQHSAAMSKQKQGRWSIRCMYVCTFLHHSYAWGNWGHVRA